MAKKLFPILGDVWHPGGFIDWAMAERAYQVYSFHYGTSQSLERLKERGGLGLYEIYTLLEGEDYKRAYKNGFRFEKIVEQPND